MKNSAQNTTAKKSITPVVGALLVAGALPFIAANFAIVGVAAVATLAFADSNVVIKAFRLITSLFSAAALKIQKIFTREEEAETPSNPSGGNDAKTKAAYPDFSDSGHTTRTDNAERYAKRDGPSRGQSNGVA